MLQLFCFVLMQIAFNFATGYKTSDCKYTITYATDTQLKYDWKCPDDGSKVCLKVHHCEAVDSENFSKLIVDDNGCSINKTLISDISYPEDLIASATSDFPWLTSTRQKIYFRCQMNFSTKLSDICERPQCGGSNTPPGPIDRRRRFARTLDSEMVIMKMIVH